jgi:hypothetical protein
MPSSTCPSYNYPYLSRPVSATISVTPVSTNVHLINYATLTFAASIHPARVLGCRLPDSWAVTSIGIKVLSLHGSRILYLSSRLWIFKIFQNWLNCLIISNYKPFSNPIWHNHFIPISNFFNPYLASSKHRHFSKSNSGAYFKLWLQLYFSKSNSGAYSNFRLFFNLHGSPS